MRNTEPDWENDYKTDPYSAWVHNVLEAGVHALNNEGALNDHEHNIIMSTMDKLYDMDPALHTERKRK